jgi:hypothetical protein
MFRSLSLIVVRKISQWGKIISICWVIMMAFKITKIGSSFILRILAQQMWPGYPLPHMLDSLPGIVVGESKKGVEKSLFWPII